jgi:hypothetical protein
MVHGIWLGWALLSSAWLGFAMVGCGQLGFACYGNLWFAMVGLA